jgi:hypothetical protein
MTDITRDNNADENEPQTPSAISDDWEGLDASPEEASSWEPLADPEDSVLGAGPEFEPHTCAPLEWYLMKLLAPCEDAPRERVPQPADTALLEEMPAPEEFDAPAPPERPDGAEKPQETKPLWQTMDPGVSQAPAAAAEASPAAPPAPADAEETPSPRKRPAAKLKKRPTIRSLSKGERTGSGRQKLMTALIPILALVMVVIVKHPLGARSPVKAANESPTRTARPIGTEVQIAWEIPSPYDPAGRDPMKGTPPAAVAVENDGTPAAAAEPPIELLVTGILYSPDNPAAIVDTQVVHEGQQISGATVKKIDRDGIQFERNGRKWKQTVTQQ